MADALIRQRNGFQTINLDCRSLSIPAVAIDADRHSFVAAIPDGNVCVSLSYQTRFGLACRYYRAFRAIFPADVHRMYEMVQLNDSWYVRLCKQYNDTNLFGSYGGIRQSLRDCIIYALTGGKTNDQDRFDFVYANAGGWMPYPRAFSNETINRVMCLFEFGHGIG